MKLLTVCIVVCMYYGNVSVGHGIQGRIGIRFDPYDHKIVRIYKNTPAAEANLRVGDHILHVNDKDIVGPAYTKVNLTIKRGSRIFTVVVERIPRELVDENQIQEDEKQIDIDPDIRPEGC